jgi:hypothetical protein
MQMPTGKFASINGRHVTLGDMVGEAKLLEIKDFGVEMELGGRRFILPVGGRPVIAPPPPDETAGN